MSSNYLENQIDEAFAGHGWPAGKDAPTLLMDAARELRQFRGTLSLAEEGLANYAQEIQELTAALTDARSMNYESEVAGLCEENKRLRAQLRDCETLLAAHDPKRECGYWLRTMPPEPQTCAQSDK